MRWIDRGPEPAGTGGYAQQFTQGWLDYFEHRIGTRPEDSNWREFRPALGSRSNNICWYCERKCSVTADTGGLAPTVDHFRPLSKFPALAYVWSNWVFSCRRCNGEKDDGWPEQGYVDPCADIPEERPEQYFDYDLATGEIVPKIGLKGDDRVKSVRTINDLGLNRFDLLFYRLDHTRGFIEDLREMPAGDRQEFIAFFFEQSGEYAGVTRMVVEQMPDLFSRDAS